MHLDNVSSLPPPPPHVDSCETLGYAVAENHDYKDDSAAINENQGHNDSAAAAENRDKKTDLPSMNLEVINSSSQGETKEDACIAKNGEPSATRENAVKIDITVQLTSKWITSNSRIQS